MEEQRLEHDRLKPGGTGMGFTLRHKGLILVILPLAFQLASFTLLFLALLETEDAVRKEAHARSVIYHMNMVTQHVVLEASSAIFLYGITHKDEYLNRYRSATAQVPEEFRILHRLLNANPNQLHALDRVEDVVSRVLTFFDEARRAARRRDVATAIQYLSEVKALSEEARKDMETLNEPYRKVEAGSSLRQERARESLKRFLLFASATGVVLALTLFAYFTKDLEVRLATIVDNTLRFAAGKTLNSPLRGGDEIARLDHVFHAMTAEITRGARQKQEFMAMITHDIRTPLNAVIGSLDLLAGKYQHVQEALPIVERCVNSVQRLLRLITDLLDIEKLESGKMKMHLEPMPFAYALEHSIQAMKVQADQKQIKLEVPEADTEVIGDGDRLVQVLINLLSNSMKYAPDHSTVTIDLEEDDTWLEVSISDRGPGIPAEYIDTVFQRFQQVDSPDRRKHGGTGLGLAICKEIITAHNGTIGVESKEGEGARFWFRLPRAEGNPPPADSRG